MGGGSPLVGCMKRKRRQSGKNTSLTGGRKGLGEFEGKPKRAKVEGECFPASHGGKESREWAMLGGVVGMQIVKKIVVSSAVFRVFGNP